MNKNKSSIFRNKAMSATILLIVILIINMWITTSAFHNYIEKKSIQILWDNVDELTNDIVKMENHDREQLQNIAEYIAKEEETDSTEVQNILSSFEEEGILGNLYILLPDNTFLSCDGNKIANESDIDFQEESMKETYVSSMREQFADIHEKVIYHAVPIEKNGEVTGVLYGVIKLQQLTELYEVHCFDGQAEMYLVEGNSGNFLMDTWHKSLGNMDEMGSRQMKKGYDFAKTREDFRNGKKGMAVFVSKTIGKYLYYCYEPVGINDWLVAMTIPEPVVFQDSLAIRRNMWICTAVNAISVMIYFIWILYYRKKENIEKEAQLNQVNYMYKIQEILFDAHQNSERMKEALNLVAERLIAKEAFFIVIEKGKTTEIYTSENQNMLSADYEELISYMQTDEEKRKSNVCYNIELLKNSMSPLYMKLKELGICNFMVTQIKDSNQHTFGIIGAWNMKHKWKDSQYLDCVSMQFFSAYKNIKKQEEIDELASVDKLTSLLNRNSYELALKRYTKQQEIPIACIYIDVNGLHDLNNSLGHSAGDEMLCFIANAMKSIFIGEAVYRIGGDEFLIFVFHDTKEKIEKKIKALCNKAESNEYYISVGTEYESNHCKIQNMIANAEQKMYANKKEYYKSNKNKRKERSVNKKLEEMLFNKKDMEKFISFVSPRFIGICIVDMEKETSRAICIVDYFQKLLDENSGNFNLALQTYIDKFVIEEEQSKLFEILQFKNMKKYFEQNESYVFMYNKKDGDKIQLSISKTKEYNENVKETVWIFEKMQEE